MHACVHLVFFKKNIENSNVLHGKNPKNVCMSKKPMKTKNVKITKRDKKDKNAKKTKKYKKARNAKFSKNASYEKCQKCQIGQEWQIAKYQ